MIAYEELGKLRKLRKEREKLIPKVADKKNQSETKIKENHTKKVDYNIAE